MQPAADSSPLGAITTAGLLITLELPHIPVPRQPDARNFSSRFQDDPPAVVTSEPPPAAAPGRNEPSTG